MKKIMVGGIYIAILTVGGYYYFSGHQLSDLNLDTQQTVEALGTQNRENKLPQVQEPIIANQQATQGAAMILPEGAKIVQDPMVDFVTTSGYKPSAIKKFTEFTGKEILLLSELPDDEKKLVIEDLEVIKKLGYLKVPQDYADKFMGVVNYISHQEPPAEHLVFQPSDISQALYSMGYDYMGVISPHINVNANADWNSMIQVFQAGDDIISVDQGGIGRGGVSLITEGYDNVYLQNQEYPASYLKNRAEDGTEFYSLSFSSGKTTFKLMSTKEDKSGLTQLAEKLLEADLVKQKG
ncbi:hypothetical protein [Algicola sagamiensis]|uniref:hypothetical protein n=1 Tax=Algicola sagamiensis TaxID=163869 RepID=UPI00036BD766|nr:hypothetical protein [Algicola sagamiensis]